MQRKEKNEESPLMRDYRDDWRVMGQEGYLMDKHLVHRRFDRAICRDDFLQCEFCWRILDDKMCYFESEKQYWVCEACFNEFRPYFHWTVTEAEDDEE